MVDGNVIRVLSRQLGLLADPKSNKAVVDAIWAVAEALVQMVAAEAQRSDAGFECAHDSVAVPVSDRPGRWGQALMELGSTICTPKPNCEQCPITSTCRAYGEGQLLAGKPKQAAGPDGSRRGDPTEIEDLCHLCEPLEETEVLDDSRPLSTATAATNAAPRPRKTRRSTREGAKSRFFERESTDDDEQDALAVIVEHARRFPIKSVKKTLRQEDSLVCAIRRPSDGSYLIRRRPSKGQLAGLWELPNRPLSGDNAPPAGAGKGAPATNVPKPSTTGSRKQEAESFVSELLLGLGGKRSGTTSTTRSRGSRPPAARHVGELGCVPWQFSHLKLAMHVHLFVLVEPSGSSARDDQALADDHSSSPLLRWASPDEIEAESMGTGMRKCWELVTQSR
ncbi:hypothetical protein VTK73DRAFT_9022 [Phialemonium thermophilum]|uniref:Adenine DNA glycosylase n=1 Tax=Phialemonium thermophilum TaxID=223376 RepID=A0ABR3W4Z8_9PEZI